MTLRTIRIYPDPVLRKKARSVNELSNGIQKLIDSMIETLNWANGIGLAAPQIGELLRIVIIDPRVEDSTKKPLCIINPEIIEEKGSQVAEEGCLSIPGIYESLKRPSSVLLRGLGRDSAPIELELGGIMARAISHEVDHLDGILFIDKLSSLRKTLLKSKLRKLKENPDRQRSPLF